MKKKLLIALSILILVSALSVALYFIIRKDNEMPPEEEYVPPVYPPSEGLTFTLSEDETYYIWTGKGTCEDSRIVVPAEYNGKPVKEVSYVLPTLQSDYTLEELVLSEGIETISKESFVGCYSLHTVTIPKSLVEIGKSAFNTCPIETIYINNLESWLNIDGYIYGCGWPTDYYIEGKLLTNLAIPKGTKSIRLNAFCGAKNIKTLTIPDGVETIGVGAFFRCEDLVSVYLPNTLKTIETNAFYKCETLETVDIPASVTTIAHGAFAENHSLRRVTLGKNLESIEGSAFNYCHALVEVCNKSSLTLEIGSSDNGYVAANAKKITTNHNDTCIKIVNDYVFYVDGDNSILLYYTGNDTNLVLPDISYKYEINKFAFVTSEVESIIIPEFVTAMGIYAFYDCNNLKNVEIRGDIPIVENHAFYGCELLETIILPDSLLSIGNYAFANCYALKSIVIPDGCESIGEYAFSDCNSFTNVTLPASVTSIGKYAFSNCDGIKSITALGTVTTIEEGTFSSCISLISINIPDSVTQIDRYAFSYCRSLYTITIPKGMKRIASDAFDDCKSLKEICNKSTAGIHQGNGVNIIKDESQSKLKYVGDYVFYDDGTDVYLIKYIGEDTELILPEYEGGKEYKIYRYAFMDNDNITSVVISCSVTYMEYWAFGFCDSLNSVFIPDSVVNMDICVFEYSNSVTIYCEMEAMPEGWNDTWNNSRDTEAGKDIKLPVVWGAKN